jgi:hypothetical protein
MKHETTDAKPATLGKYEPPTVEDVPISPEERLLVACKSPGAFNPACQAACESCSAPGS